MKSFSRLTKEELCREDRTKTCCNQAEYMGMLLFGGPVNDDVLSHWEKLAAQQKEPPAEFRIPKELIVRDCCQRALVRGAFLSGGTVIDPRKNYNLELVTPYAALSGDLLNLLREIGFPFKQVVRKGKYVLYLKNSESISDFLSYMGAFQAQMELLNIKIEKEIRNDFNRAANSETANIEKTINAAVMQIQAIDRLPLEELPDELREVAMLRLKHKDKSLSELGKLMNPPLSKSGVNHRMKKLLQMAEERE
ncbi:MAG: DNA-binding protein WhiA [Clostridia bacterium]|nr:DNA-binding protein WhiA [Clostridia bacterium]